MPYKGERPLLMRMVISLPNEIFNYLTASPFMDEIKRWVLSLGPEAAVLEPEQLKEMVRKDLCRNLAQYSKNPVLFVMPMG